MATCEHCASGNHEACLEENAGKITGCPGCCQHRINGKPRNITMTQVGEGRYSHIQREAYTPIEIAYMMGIHVRKVRKLVKDGVIVGRKVDGSWIIGRDNLIAYFKEIYGDTSD